MGNAVLQSTVGGAALDVAAVRAALVDSDRVFHRQGDVPERLADLVGRFVAPSYVIELAGRNIADTRAGCVADRESIRFAGVVRDESEQAQALVEWHVHPDVDDPYLRLEWVVRAGGEGARPHLRAALDFALGAGFASIRLDAGLRSGPTYWARAGFDFVQESARMFVNEIADELLGDYLQEPRFATAYDAWRYDDEQATIRAAFDALERIAPTYRSPLQFKAMLASSHHAVDVDEARPLGHAALYAINPWAGRLDLADAQAVARFRELLGEA